MFDISGWLQQGLFWGLSTIVVFSALMVVSSRNPVRGALFLVLAFVASSGLWLLLQAEFLALVLILVYVGAVMTLFLFVVMMLNIDTESSQKKWVRYFPFAILVALFAIGVTVYVLHQTPFATNAVSLGGVTNNIKALGNVLYTHYVLAFELAAMILLAAIVAAICLALPEQRDRLIQAPEDQVKVTKADRLKIVKM